MQSSSSFLLSAQMSTKRFEHRQHLRQLVGIMYGRYFQRAGTYLVFPNFSDCSLRNSLTYLPLVNMWQIAISLFADVEEVFVQAPGYTVGPSAIWPLEDRAGSILVLSYSLVSPAPTNPFTFPSPNGPSRLSMEVATSFPPISYLHRYLDPALIRV